MYELKLSKWQKKIMDEIWSEMMACCGDVHTEDMCENCYGRAHRLEVVATAEE